MADDDVFGGLEEKELPLGALDSPSGGLAGAVPGAIGAAAQEAGDQVKDYALEQVGVTPLPVPPKQPEPSANPQEFVSGLQTENPDEPKGVPVAPAAPTAPTPTQSE